VVFAGLAVALLGNGLLAGVDDLFAQPDALTGRTEIWHALLTYAQNNPLFGAGYGSFWNIGAKSPMGDLSHDWIARVGTGHNGYLDTTVTIGVPGLILAVLALFIAPTARLTGATNIPSRTAGLLVAMLLFCAAHNFTESTMLERDMIMWVFLLITVAMTTKAAKESRAASKRAETQDPAV
jgi:O-antigen ligase